MTGRIAYRLAGAVLGIALLLVGCSVPQLAYNHADSLLRFKLYAYLDPTQEQDLMMSNAVQRLHEWHRHNELPRYADAFAQMAQRVETGLHETDIAWSRDLVHERYRALAARAIDDALPTVRTLNADNFAALEREFADRNEDYADEYLAGDAARQRDAMIENLEDHLKRWIDDLTSDQKTLLARFVESQPHFAALRLENRRFLQQQTLAALRDVARGQPGAEDSLRDIAANWETYSTPQYRQALREWERGMIVTFIALDRQLTATQRNTAVTRLREYSNDLYALTDRESTRSASARAGGSGWAMP
jgi:hypothetical protein